MHYLGKYKKHFLTLLAMLMLSSVALGEKVYLRDGTVIVGQIVKQTANLIYIQTKLGKLKIEKSQVVKIIFSKTENSKFEFGEKWVSVGLAIGRELPTDTSLRELYGDAFVFQMLFSYFAGKKDELELIVAYSKRQSELLDMTNLKKIPFFVRYKRIFGGQTRFFPYWAIGGSYTYATVQTSGIVENLADMEPAEEFTQTDKGFGINSAIGSYLFLQDFTLFGEIEYEYTFLGRPKVGRLGNVGGMGISIGTKINF